MGYKLNDLTTKTKVIFTLNDFVFTPDFVFKSKEFMIGSNLWEVIVWPTKTIENPRDLMFAISLRLKSEWIYVSLQFDSCIYDSNMKTKYYIKNYSNDGLRYEEEFTATNYTMTTREFMAQKDILVPNKRLIIGLNIVVGSNDVYECIPTIISHRKSFNVKEFNDLHIVCGNKEFFVSKAILTSHSEVFQKMFENKMREQNTNQLIIKDFDGEVFEEFLKFIYFGNSDKLEELKEDLLIIADKYHVLNLKKICANFIFVEICVLNAIKILKTLNKYNCYYVEVKAIKFISKNVPEIREKTRNEWQDLIKRHNQLLGRITERMGEVIKGGKISDKTIKNRFKYFTFNFIN